MKLSDKEKQEVIRLLEEGEPLPDRYRFLLFKKNTKGRATLARQDSSCLQHCPALPNSGANRRTPQGRNRTRDTL